MYRQARPAGHSRLLGWEREARGGGGWEGEKSLKRREGLCFRSQGGRLTARLKRLGTSFGVACRGHTRWDCSGAESLREANDAYWLSIMLAGAEQVQPLVGQGTVVATAGRRLFMVQGADCEREGILSEGTILIVVLTEALAVFAELLNAFPGRMHHIVDLRAVPVLQPSPHVVHEAVTVSMETLRVVDLGVVDM